jgi:uncharacterized membrane protein YphA (DoxX/SURF4 family)
MKKKVIVDVATYLLVLLFVYTSLSKVFDFKAFRIQLERQPLTMHVAQLLTFALPLFEMMIAILLVIPRLRKLGLYASLYLMAAFTMYVGYMLAAYPKEKLPCTCGGLLRVMNWEQHLIFNLTFTFLAFSGIWISRKLQNKNDNNSGRANYV